MKGYISDNDVEKCVKLLLDKYNLSTNFICRLYGMESKNGGVGVVKSIGNNELDNREMLCTLLVYKEGINLFSGSSEEKIGLRNRIIKSFSDEDICSLYNKYPDFNRNITTPSYMCTSLAKRQWYAGKNWACDFIELSGLPIAFAGLSKEEAETKKTIDIFHPKEPVPQLVEYQVEIKNKLLDILNRETNKSRCMISLPTGGGKTRVAVESFLDWLMEKFNENKYLLWVAQSEELCEQCISCVEQLWKDREFISPLRVYRFFAKYGDISLEDLQGGVVVASITKIYKRLKGENEKAIREILRNTGAIIIDEAHRSLSMMYDVLFEEANKETDGKLFPVCGLSATPGRNTFSFSSSTKELVDLFEMNLVYPTFANEETYSEHPLKFFKDNQYLSRVNHFTYRSGIEYQLTEKDLSELSPTEEYSASFLKKLAKDDKRNTLIVNRILKIPKHQPTLVYCCSVEHSKLLSTMLRFYNRSAAFISSDTNNTERRSIIKAFREGHIDFLCNFGVLTTGFDAPKTQNIVICRPIHSDILYEQIVGRGIRGVKFGGTIECNVIDFSDNISNLGEAQAFMRFKKYWDNNTEEA